jgi:hypothetical protein
MTHNAEFDDIAADYEAQHTACTRSEVLDFCSGIANESAPRWLERYMSGIPLGAAIFVCRRMGL